MKKTQIWRILGWIAAGILPLLVISLGTLLMWSGLIPNIMNVITFFILPCLAFGICFLMIRSRRKLWLKWIVCILTLALFVFCSGSLMLFGPYAKRNYRTGNDALVQFHSDCEDGNAFFYTISDLGQPEGMEYQYYYKQVGVFFDTYAHTMICQYSASDYQTQKTFLNETYVFQTEPMEEQGYTIEPENETDGYTFRFLSFDEELYGLLYPKYMTILGFNDETQEIVYLYFNDDDLDWIQSWDEFLSDECGWNHIR